MKETLRPVCYASRRAHMSLAAVPLQEGLAFDTGPEGVFAVQDYELAHHKSVRVERASGSDRRMVCSSEAPCGFFVQIYRQRKADKKTYGKWYIASLNLVHSETCDSVRRVTTRQIAELPAFMEAVQTNPRSSIESLMGVVLERHGVQLDKHLRLVYRARDLVRSGKAVAGRNLLSNPDVPLPERQFVRRHTKGKKTSPEIKKPKNQGRMTWTDVLIESLLIERIAKYGKQFIAAGEQSQHRELWETIQNEFNAMHNEAVTVLQLRAKFRYLQEQYQKVHAEENEAERDASKSVIYPRCWEMLVEYFGDEDNVGVDHGGGVETEGNCNQTVASQPDNVQPAHPAPFVLQSGAAFVQAPPLQPVLNPVYSTPAQAAPQTQTLMVRPPSSPVLLDVAPKRRRVNPPEVLTLHQDQHTGASAADSSTDVIQKLETIQNVQSDMARSMDGIKHVVEQSNQVIRGLEQALNQSNQVNAALLDFLRRQPSV
ncbi:hypothetical protein P3T76_006935 [Phytophthora citrophthora]|uniref:Myb/SANT-like domain-containing protein n=1 Tax=Phytophthora citrophthora TaxID=4793 RepID=A0AAD9LMX5_9STRA|nr:hypothetical protein P3T76_006935 [Phytophthora citrophthora]